MENLVSDTFAASYLQSIPPDRDTAFYGVSHLDPIDDDSIDCALDTFKKAALDNFEITVDAEEAGKPWRKVQFNIRRSVRSVLSDSPVESAPISFQELSRPPYTPGLSRSR